MQNRIRVVHIAQAAGGVEQYIKMLLKYMDSTKFENILIASEGYHAENYVNLADYFEQVDMSRAIGMNDLKAARKVRTLIKQYNPDIVYAHSSKAGAIARIADVGLKNCLLYNPHKDQKVLRESTAGGAFTAIAKYALRHGGVVFGVELSNQLVAHHIYVETEKDLARFRNSKYVQSDVWGGHIQTS